MSAMLPIYAIKDEFIAQLREVGRIVVTAPTGSGKSTQIPRFIEEGLSLPEGQRILVLQPRRLAARMLAERVAAECGGEPGELVGFQTRYERAVSGQTKILFITEGILTRLLISDPSLKGVGAIVFDEFHERSLNIDLGLAMAWHCVQTRRPDLRLIVMSATLAAAPLQAYLGDCPHVHAEGRSYPVSIMYSPLPANQGAPITAAQALRRLLQAGVPGDVLIFMPGGYEIRATAEECRRLPMASELSIHLLYGDLPPSEQRQVMAPSDRRKVIIATNIAETSLTIPGVRHVIDSGLARIARHDSGRGVNLLETRPIARDSADQRTGRAGREAAGTCIRLWSEIVHSAKPSQSVPEIQRLDLAEAVLAVMAYGFSDPGSFPWLEAPPERALSAARQLLGQLGLVDASGNLTALGEDLRHAPAHPRLALLLWLGVQEGCIEEASLAAAILSERPVRVSSSATPRSQGTRRRQEAKRRARQASLPESDFLETFHLLRVAQEVRFEQQQCVGLGLNAGAARDVMRAAQDFLSESRRLWGDSGSSQDSELSFLQCLLRVFPDRLARRRDQGTLVCELSGRRLAELSRESVVRGEALFLACEARETGQASQPGTKTILSLASGVREQWLWDFFPDAWEETDIAVWDDSQQQVVRRQSLSCLGIVLEEKLRQDPDPEAAAEILACLLDDGKLALPGWDDDVERWIARVRWLAEMFPEQGLPSYDESDRAKVHRLLCAGETSYRAVKNKECLAAVRQLLPRSQVQFVEAMAPAQVMLPNGRRMRLEYTPGQAPKGRSRIQDFYDMVETPRVAGGAVPVLLDILAPNYRTVQITDDLKRFWDVHYPRIKPELARRYPRHVWR